MSDWKEYKLDELVEITSSKRIMRSEYQENGIPFFRSKEIIELNSGNEITTELFISKERFLEIKNKFGTPSYGDILLTSVGTLGVPYFVNYKEEFYFKDGNLTWFRKFNNILRSKYLYYWFSSPVGRKALKEITIGSTQPALTITGLKSLTIHLPTLEEQDYIIEILDHLSSKIHLNTQINQTLEQIAQALFKSWFVDFDPVRAKVQALSDGLSLEKAELAAMQAISGKTPEELTALSQTQPERYAELAETAKAFPCEMVEVDGVEVPKGWKIGTFTDITESRREKVKNDKATVLSAVSSGELVKSEEYFTKQVFSKSIDKYLKVYQWDFAYNPARINIGSIGLHEADYLGAVSPVYEVFSVSDKYHWFLKRILNLETTKIKIQSLCTGSVRQTLKLKDFQFIDCVIPDEKTLSIFNKKWEEYRTLILENNENTQTLSEIRDLLLPRLLSGDFNG
ncbi:MAG: restriction endonuclease subunit S [Neisseria meningitidis]|nr:restriction endonuclease subunit S [Neisseria meningitidis]